jgi:iron complex outermembrane receptor protein
MKRSVLAAATLAALEAAAQSAPPSGGTLRPIVVTPTPGVAQQAFDTPASVDVVTGEQIRNAQLQVNLSESLVRVPGVVALNRQNYAQDLQISVRGFGARSTFGVRGIRLYSDGIPATMPDGQGQVWHFDLSSAGRAEGRCAGPVAVRQPSTAYQPVHRRRPAGHATGRRCRRGQRRVQRENLRFAGEQGAWNWNLDAAHFKTDGFRDHSAAKRTGFNGKLRWQPSPDTRVTFVANAVDMPDTQDPLGLTRTEWEADPTQASPVALTFNTRKSVNQQQAGAIVEHRINEVHSLRFTGWGGQRSTEQFQAIPTAVQAPITHPGGVIVLDRDYRGVDGQWIARTRAFGGGLTLTAGLLSKSWGAPAGLPEFLQHWHAPTALGDGRAAARRGQPAASTVCAGGRRALQRHGGPAPFRGEFESRDHHRGRQQRRQQLSALRRLTPVLASPGTLGRAEPMPH